jgi:hypothetical protein
MINNIAKEENNVPQANELLAPALAIIDDLKEIVSLGYSQAQQRLDQESTKLAVKINQSKAVDNELARNRKWQDFAHLISLNKEQKQSLGFAGAVRLKEQELEDQDEVTKVVLTRYRFDQNDNLVSKQFRLGLKEVKVVSLEGWDAKSDQWQDFGLSKALQDLGNRDNLRKALLATQLTYLVNQAFE